MPYHIAGIDVHKKMLAVAVADVEVEGDYHFERLKVGTSPVQLRALADWLVEREVEEVVMESTAQYWRPVWEALERYWRSKRRMRTDANPLSGTLHLAAFGACADLHPVYRRLVKLTLDELRVIEDQQCPRVGDNVERMALTEHDLAAIRAAIEKDAAAVRRADWDAITRMFTADAIRFPPHQPPIRGRAAMRAWLETFPPLEEFAITADEIVGGDGLAFVRGTYDMTIGGPKPVTDRGNYMGLMRKQPDGSWLWTTDMAVSELPAPMA